MELNQDFINIVKPVVMRVWNVIGMDLEACCQESEERLTNDAALESCLDCYLEIYGGEGHEKAREAIKAAEKIHGYTKVDKFLEKNIRLV